MGNERSLITDEVRALIGSGTAPRYMVIDRQVARRLAEALHEDPDMVAGAEFAPPYYFSAFETQIAPTGIPGELESGVLAADEWELHRPLRWEERVTSVGRIADVSERFGSRHGQSLYLRYEWTFTDEAGECVAVARRTMARYLGETADTRDEAPRRGTSSTSMRCRRPIGCRRWRSVRRSSTS